MTVWHVVAPVRDLTPKNGAAILRVARELTAQGRAAGTRTLVVGSVGGEVQFEDCVALISQARAASKLELG